MALSNVEDGRITDNICGTNKWSQTDKTSSMKRMWEDEAVLICPSIWPSIDDWILRVTLHRLWFSLPRQFLITSVMGGHHTNWSEFFPRLLHAWGTVTPRRPAAWRSEVWGKHCLIHVVCFGEFPYLRKPAVTRAHPGMFRACWSAVNAHVTARVVQLVVLKKKLTTTTTWQVCAL